MSSVLVSLCFFGYYYKTQYAESPFNGCHSDRQTAKETQCNENIDKRFLRQKWANLFNKAKGFNVLDPKFELWILFSCSTSQGNFFFSKISVEYNFARFIDLLTISSSLMSVYSHKNLNVFLICLNRVLSSAIIESRMGRKTSLRNSFTGVISSFERLVCHFREVLV